MDHDDTLPLDPAPKDSSAPDEQTQDGTGVSGLNDPTSRRRFLRAAVIGAAGVAGAVGAAGVAMGHGGLPGVLAVNTTPPRLSFTDPGCTMTVTDSGFNQFVGGNGCAGTGTGFNIGKHGGAQNPGDFYIWFTAPNLPTGTYTVNFTPDPAFGTMGAKPYFLDIYNGGTNYSCPTSGNPTGNGAQQSNAATLADLMPVVVPVAPTLGSPISGAAPQDLQLQVHMTYNGGVIGSVGTTKDFSFTASLTKSGQTTPVCSETIKITGTQTNS